MGSQRYLAEALTKNFSVTDNETRELVTLIEMIKMNAGDDLADAIYSLENTGNAAEALQNLTTVYARLGDTIQRLREKLAVIMVRTS
jgi:hypothetical protein